ncbi:chorismate-binding protein [Neisseria leonii]|uniref:bifunctional chorismate-binding protein/class IV aminotransferase n=1 Tax=Neisseria leonii TaxID=2995413 RepID=UPI0030CB377D
MNYFALLDDAVCGRALLFESWQSADFLTAADLDTLDARLAAGRADGLHAVVLADYEFGLPLLSLPDAGGRLALHWFGKKTAVDAVQWLAENGRDEAAIGTPQMQTGPTQYLTDVAAVQAAIARGDTYQINYTTRLHLNAYGCPVALYRRLRQPVPYAFLGCLPDAAGKESWTLCFSPELFLRLDGKGRAETEPMKGTAPFLGDGQDEARARALQADPKNRAENVMIVDLLRNDLGKLAQTGGVRVPEPFRVGRFGSVWQMTSRIEADLRPDVSAADIFRAAFPCGSITGAPKRMSMEIIGRLEHAPRGLYTGSIGHLAAADNGGVSGVLNVVIRTLTLGEEQDGVRAGVYGVGSGIVSDSEAESEYRECGWKARFLTDLRPTFGLFETLRIENGRAPLLARHLGRLKTAAAALNLAWPAELSRQVEQHIARSDGLLRGKITLNRDGWQFECRPFADFSRPQRVMLSSQAAATDWTRRFKTDRRGDLDTLWQTAEQHGAFDMLCFDRQGRLLEGGRSNVFVKSGGCWYTPAAGLPILNGVMRQAVLADPQHYLGCNRVIEAEIDRPMLENAEEIRLSNALRGLFHATLTQ